MTDLSTIAPAFVDMAHSIVRATVSTVHSSGRPRSRVLHPIWEWDGERLPGWVATRPDSPKAADIDHRPDVAITYWHPNQDTCTADCRAVWETTVEERRVAWDRFESAPEPVGYSPTLIPGWTAPDVPSFGVLRLEPAWLRVFPGTLLLRGEGELLTWSTGDD